MLPTFQIRDLKDIEELQLDPKREYDELIDDLPVATLGYVDDDGEVITVGFLSVLHKHTLSLFLSLAVQSQYSRVPEN